MTLTLIDYMEYANDAAAQAEYVTSDVGNVPTAAYATGSNDLVSHFDGADAATSYSDPVKGAYTFVGGAQLDTAQYKWGTASLLLGGNGDCVTLGESTSWDFGAGDFTVDFWFRPAVWADHNYQFIGQYSYGDNNSAWCFWGNGGGSQNLALKYTTDGSTLKTLYVNYTFSINNWYHIAMVRNGANLMFFVNGVQAGATQNIGTDTIYNSSRNLEIGGQVRWGGFWLNGWMDEVRILKGTAVWTSNFNAGALLQSYSEATIKTQGSYALKEVAAITGSLNKTLIKTFASPLDLSGLKTIKLDMRASRTGANIKLGLHDTGGTTTEFTPTINSEDTYETKTWDISAVADADKNAIDKLIFTTVNADAANIIYFDNIYALNQHKRIILI